jgi:hypothetical protein
MYLVHDLAELELMTEILISMRNETYVPYSVATFYDNWIDRELTKQVRYLRRRWSDRRFKRPLNVKDFIDMREMRSSELSPK